MAKKSYIGINGNARKIKKWYIGVNGIARKVKKAYIGVDGIARQFYSSDSFMWDRYSVVSGKGLKLTNEYNTRLGSVHSNSVSYGSKYRSAKYDFYNNYEDAYNALRNIISGYYFNVDLLKGTLNPRQKKEIPFETYCIYHNDSRDLTDSYYYSSNNIQYNVFDDRVYERMIIGHCSSNGELSLKEFSVSSNVPSKGSYIDTVESENPNAYPNNGVFNGYWYVRR